MNGRRDHRRSSRSGERRPPQRAASTHQKGRVETAPATETRRLAIEALGRIDSGGAFANLVVPQMLERSGLVQTRKDGRSRTCELVGSRLAEAEQWLAAQRALWEARADRLVEFVERRHQEDSTHVSQPRRPRRNP